VPLPKILIVSHNCLSESGSNGRTLSNFLRGFPSEHLAQFYIYNEVPSSDVCRNYYRITDKEALKSLISSKYGVTVISKEIAKESGQLVEEYKKPKRTPLVYYIREWIWDCGHWKNRRLKKWIDDFSPDIVLFQAGDAAFLYKFALRVAKERSIPLVIYNSESYYFKDTNFLAKSFASDFFYRILHHHFCKYAKKTIAYASHSIYITDALKDLYAKEFCGASTTIMTSSALTGSISEVSKTENKISYLGNLGVGRYETLIELAQMLQEISPVLTIDVYGNASDDVIAKLNEAIGIRYCGFVSYEQCTQVMRESEVLIHVENFSEFYLEDSKYAFSTKIADSLASGTCLFVYAPKELYCSKYLKDSGAASVATNPMEAMQLMQTILSNENVRNQYAKRGREIAENNHSIDKNREVFQAIIKGVFDESLAN